MRDNLEHPDITMALQTGYPHKRDWPRVCDCCEETPLIDIYFEVDGMDVCENCLFAIAKEIIEEDRRIAEEITGAVRRSAD